MAGINVLRRLALRGHLRRIRRTGHAAGTQLLALDVVLGARWLDAVGLAGLVIASSFSSVVRDAECVAPCFAAGHADLDFMSLTKREGCGGDRGFERSFLGGIGIPDVAIVQHAPLVPHRHDGILSKAHCPTPGFEFQKNVRQTTRARA
ncbi:hypothetical protein UNPF46_21415 [Bradyrhizobium sp. UNPF46]|nr:hypothetical protein UNPF46_21415 [Bradyrhizobium sp. UNPF46]